MRWHLTGTVWALEDPRTYREVGRVWPFERRWGWFVQGKVQYQGTEKSRELAMMQVLLVLKGM